MLEHLYDPLHALVEINRVLDPGGAAVITVPNLAYWRYRIDLLTGEIPHPASDKRHIHQFNLKILLEVLDEAQFDTFRILGFGERLRKLASWKPQLFSDMLVAVVRKKRA